MKKIYLFILLLVSILFIFPTIEGFGLNQPTSPLIGEFDYLAPIPPNNVWTQDTIIKFIDKFNTVNEPSSDTMLKLNTFVDSRFFQIALEKEALYYIDNGKWPINKYVTDYIDKQNPKHPIFGQQIPGKPGKVYSLETLSTMWPTRLMYQTFIYTTEMQMTQLPISYQIFKGITPPPPSDMPALGTSAPPDNENKMPSFDTSSMPSFDTSKMTGNTESTPEETSSTPSTDTSGMPSVDTSSMPSFDTSSMPSFDTSKMPSFGST